ncbi:2-C-methyl-D-erythritol 4-phosphate cytidylyltransferase [Alteromonas sp. AMM-1]|uniref:2-C-methyl-D-erythritol 4-phosphate cytidylyltransferase n=1 Tax=Alteromonas sp. AMM-1 TaxID=3394233 RepID=UPI0039A4A10D
MTVPTIVAVVPAAGIGARMQANKPKQYLTIGKYTILEHTLLALKAHPAVSRIVVALNPDDTYFHQLSIHNAPWLTTVEGGDSRAVSVNNALAALNEDEWALVHDAARPCISQQDLDTLIGHIQKADFNGGILATPVRDTMKRAKSDSAPAVIAHTESRDNLWHALTPQLFRAGELRRALNAALAAGADITDEASAMEFAGKDVLLIDGNPANIKVTRPADLPLATFYLQQGEQQ